MKVKNSPSISPVFAVLKRRLKVRGLKYRDLAQELDTTEVSVKRWFSKENLTLKQLTDIAGILGTTAADIMQEAAQPPPHYLTAKQEQELMNDPQLLLVTTCVLAHWSMEDIVRHYNLTEAECVKHLLVLDRLRLIDLLPQHRIQLRIARDFEALPGSPMWHYVRGPVMREFLNDWPQDKQQNIVFLRAMLTSDAILQFEEQVRRLKQKLHELHMESLNAPLEQRHRYAGYIAHRKWEAKAFAELRRKS